MNLKKATRARQRAQAMTHGGNLVFITRSNFGKLLKEWGWQRAPTTPGAGNGGGGHQKWRWHGHQVNFSNGTGDAMPRVVLERVAAVMGMSVTELLMGPVLGNDGIRKAMEMAEAGRDRWATLGDRLHTDPRYRVHGDDGDEYDLTADIPADPDAEEPDAGVQVAAVVRLCPHCTKPLDEHSSCLLHGLQVVWPPPGAPLTMADLEVWSHYQSRFMELDVAGRRAFLLIQRRLKEEGLLNDADIKPTPTQKVYTAATAGWHTIVAPTSKETAMPKETTMSNTTTETSTNGAATSNGSSAAAARGAAAFAARREQGESRKAGAPPMGSARTIDEVLARAPLAVGPSRRLVLEALVDLGGVFRDPDGGAITRFNDHMRRQRRGVTGSGGAMSGLLRSMVADNQIQKTGEMRRTFSISLVDPLEDEFARRGVKPAVPVPDAEPEATEAPSQQDSRRTAMLDAAFEMAQGPAGIAPETWAGPVPEEIQGLTDADMATLPKVEPVPAVGHPPIAPDRPADSPVAPSLTPKAAMAQSPDSTIDRDTVLEVAFIDRGGRIFLQTDDGKTLVVESFKWV